MARFWPRTATSIAALSALHCRTAATHSSPQRTKSPLLVPAYRGIGVGVRYSAGGRTTITAGAGVTAAGGGVAQETADVARMASSGPLSSRRGLEQPLEFGPRGRERRRGAGRLIPLHMDCLLKILELRAKLGAGRLVTSNRELQQVAASFRRACAILSRYSALHGPAVLPPLPPPEKRGQRREREPAGEPGADFVAGEDQR